MKLLRITVALSAMFAASAALAQEITVWADATRQPAVEAFRQAYRQTFRQ